MNPVERSLRRLFQAAALAPKPADETMPFGFDTLVMARWRSRPTEDEFAVLLAALFRRAVICAGLVVFLSIVWGSLGNASDASGVVALANYEINTHLPP